MEMQQKIKQMIGDTERNIRISKEIILERQILDENHDYLSKTLLTEEARLLKLYSKLGEFVDQEVAI